MKKNKEDKSTEIVLEKYKDEKRQIAAIRWTEHTHWRGKWKWYICLEAEAVWGRRDESSSKEL